MKLTIISKEEGRGKGQRHTFSTLEKASAFIQARWQGVEYMDGRDGFHTDYCTYTLKGFTLRDIGRVVFEEGISCPVDFVFQVPQDDTNGGKARIVVQSTHGIDGDNYHFRATEPWIARAQKHADHPECDWTMKVYTDAQYIAKFGIPVEQSLGFDEKVLDVEAPAPAPAPRVLDPATRYRCTVNAHGRDNAITMTGACPKCNSQLVNALLKVMTPLQLAHGFVHAESSFGMLRETLPWLSLLSTKVLAAGKIPNNQDTRDRLDNLINRITATTKEVVS